MGRKVSISDRLNFERMFGLLQEQRENVHNNRVSILSRCL